MSSAKSGDNSKLVKVIHSYAEWQSFSAAEPWETWGSSQQKPWEEARQGARTYTWGGITLCVCMRWEVTVRVAILLKRSWCAGGCCAEHEPTTQGHVNKWNSMAGLQWEDHGWQMKGSDYHLLHGDEALPGALCPCFLCHPCLGQVWFRETGHSPAERDAEMVRDMEVAAYMEKLKELCLFSITKRKQSSDVMAAYKCLCLALSSLQLIFLLVATV